MARSYVIFGDIDGKLHVLRIECKRADARAGMARIMWN
jgi:hypothetical protein